MKKKIFIIAFLLILLFSFPLSAGDTLPMFLFWIVGPNQGEIDAHDTYEIYQVSDGDGGWENYQYRIE